MRIYCFKSKLLLFCVYFKQCVQLFFIRSDAHFVHVFLVFLRFLAVFYFFRRRQLVEGLMKTLAATGRCENCNAFSPTIRKDGSNKLFQVWRGYSYRTLPRIYFYFYFVIFNFCKFLLVLLFFVNFCYFCYFFFCHLKPIRSTEVKHSWWQNVNFCFGPLARQDYDEHMVWGAWCF